METTAIWLIITTTTHTTRAPLRSTRHHSTITMMDIWDQCTTTTALSGNAIQFVTEPVTAHTIVTVTIAAQTLSGSTATVNVARDGTGMTVSSNTATELPHTTVVLVMGHAMDTVMAQIPVIARPVHHTHTLTTGATVSATTDFMEMTAATIVSMSTATTLVTAHIPVITLATAQKTTTVWNALITLLKMPMDTATACMVTTETTAILQVTTTLSHMLQHLRIPATHTAMVAALVHMPTIAIPVSPIVISIWLDTVLVMITGLGITVTSMCTTSMTRTRGHAIRSVTDALDLTQRSARSVPAMRTGIAQESVYVMIIGRVTIVVSGTTQEAAQTSAMCVLDQMIPTVSNVFPPL